MKAARQRMTEYAAEGVREDDLKKKEGKKKRKAKKTEKLKSKKVRKVRHQAQVQA